VAVQIHLERNIIDSRYGGKIDNRIGKRGCRTGIAYLFAQVFCIRQALPCKAYRRFALNTRALLQDIFHSGR
jgi:hypothetical protein